jgi:hypothetical protein
MMFSLKEVLRHGDKHGLMSLDEVERWFAYRVVDARTLEAALQKHTEDADD